MDKRRLQDIVGVLLLGDGLTHLIQGKRHVALWQTQGAPESLYNRALRYLGDHPLVYGLLSAGEIALGVALMRRAERPPTAPA